MSDPLSPPPLNVKPQQIVPESLIPLNPLPAYKFQSLETFAWSAIQRIHASDGGSKGVLFCCSPDGTLVLKYASDLRPWLANEFFKLIEVPCPKLCVLRKEDAEYGILQELTKNRAKRFRTFDQSSRRKMDGFLKQPYIMVMEYAPGRSLLDLDECLQHKFKENSSSLFKTLGEIAAGDILLNNFDRIPLQVWSNDGNGSNIMFSGEGLTAIDQEITPLSGGSLDNYLKLFSKFLCSLSADNPSRRFSFDATPRSFDDAYNRLGAFLLHACLYETTGTDYGHFKKGLLDKLVWISKNWCKMQVSWKESVTAEDQRLVDPLGAFVSTVVECVKTFENRSQE
eukprot:Colp12_sorted_trinity150504_noHs@4295